MAIAEKLNHLLETKNQIKNAITAKGVSITDTDSFRSYASKIGQIESGGGMTTPSTEDWQPEADWWDIETILENDTEDYTQKVICLLTDELDDKSSKNYMTGGIKYKLSDGQVIEQLINENLDLTNLFDVSKDKVCSKGYKTRYVILYNNNSSAVNIKIPNNTIYTICDSAYFGSAVFQNLRFLKCVKLKNAKFQTYKNLFMNDSSLEKITGLNTQGATSSMNQMCAYCKSLKKIEGNLDTSNVKELSSLYYMCSSLEEMLPLDTGNATTMNQMLNGCNSLKKVKNFNMQNVTNASTLFSENFKLITIENIKNIQVSINLSSSIYLSYTSLLNVLNALVDLTGQTTQKLTLGTTNLAKLTDEEKAIATEKNWTLA